MAIDYKVKRHYPGCYRISCGLDFFIQIKKMPGYWIQEIRETETGNLICHRDSFPSLKIAVHETVHELREGARFR